MISPLPLLLTLSIFVSACTAKFSSTYRGTATDGVRTCISNSDFTPQNLTLRVNCRAAFKCVMDSIPNQGQSILSSGAAILGFIPTVLLALGSTNAEIMRIHARYPLLAFFLSITNINKRPDSTYPSHTTRSGPTVSLGPYGKVRRRDAASDTHPIAIWIIHVLAALGVAIVVWQTVEIGRNGVVSWACWTSYYPLIWIAMAVVHHVLSIVLMRISLGVEVQVTLPSKSAREPARLAKKTKSAFSCWDLTHGDLQVRVKRNKFAKWSKTTADLVNNLTYLYGTAVFASMTLVSGRVAINKLSAFGVVTVAARIAAVFVLEDIEGEE